MRYRIIRSDINRKNLTLSQTQVNKNCQTHKSATPVKLLLVLHICIFNYIRLPGSLLSPLPYNQVLTLQSRIIRVKSVVITNLLTKTLEEELTHITLYLKNVDEFIY